MADSKMNAERANSRLRLALENRVIPRGRAVGITLIEMMVVLSVLAVLLGIAAPSFDNVALSSRLTSYANDLVASANLARSEAFKRNAIVKLCISANGADCATGGWQQGWIVLAGTTVIQAHPASPAGYQMTGSVSTIDFQPTGIGSTQATITICRSSPLGSQERVVTISATGRPSVAKTTAGACS
ncbi:MAG: GspH/FimT family pseudopilin [Rhodocyclaceae bacterium]|nr:GspH/FimT family pseudopilin [Rhodocyclaceae bacterium]